MPLKVQTTSWFAEAKKEQCSKQKVNLQPPNQMEVIPAGFLFSYQEWLELYSMSKAYFSAFLT